MPHDLLGLDHRRLHALAAAAFGAQQGAGLSRRVHRQAVRDGQFAPEALGAGPRAAAAWREHFALALPDATDHVVEALPHGTLHKWLLRFPDGEAVETVVLPMGHGRHSQCLSVQVGCARGCSFCATGRLGLRRNLTAGEITAQVTFARGRGLSPQSLVFMGMGEPLDNLEALLPALQVLADPAGHGFAQDRMTVCTVGHVPGIHRLRQLGFRRLGLNLSLHAATDRQRQELMPHACRHPLAEIAAALRAYRQRANLQFGIHWCLLPGINDSDADARALAGFCRDLGRVLVHVIPYNPDHVPIGRPPSPQEVDAFVLRLRELGLPVRRRIQKGTSVAAACGQLGGRAPGHNES